MNLRQSDAWKLVKRWGGDSARRLLARAASAGRIPLMWCQGPNWGDALSPLLVSLLSGKSVIHRHGVHHHRFLVIGSILDSANEYAQLWGSGFIRENQRVLGPPRAIHAVRGPLSREALLRQNIDCPEVYGDPALLLPQFYNPRVERRYAIGIVPHYVDKRHPWVQKHRRDPQVLILDIESGIQEFVQSVKSCDLILSSSLHGLICSDAYGVPNAWVQLSDKVVGGAFKFQDYRLSIGSDDQEPNVISEDTKLVLVSAVAKKRNPNVDLRKLLLACPFLADEVRVQIMSVWT